MMKACDAGDINICIELIKAGADAKMKDKAGMTAEDHASCYRKDANIHSMLHEYLNGGGDDEEMKN